MNKPQIPSPAWSFLNDTVNEYAYWENAFSKEECEQIIDYCKTYENTEGVTSSKSSGHRISNISFISPDNNTFWIYEKLSYFSICLNADFFKFDLWGFSENLQFTEYKPPAGRYNSHIDKIFNKQIRKLSIVLQLSEDYTYEGGDLELLNNGENLPTKLNRKQGTVIAFPSYSLHRVTPVTNGIRHSLVGWITGPQFK
jgi:PKHD-type hydroxylase